MVCKTIIGGSIPLRASNPSKFSKLSLMFGGCMLALRGLAGRAELECEGLNNSRLERPSL